MQLQHHDRLLVAVVNALAQAAWRLRPALADRRSGGQALVEFALIVPLVMLLIIVAVDGGRAVLAYNTLANAARHGARVAAVNQLNPADTVTSCREDMPIEDVTVPHWSARACTAATAVGLGVTPASVTLTYAAPTDVTMSCSPTLHVGCIAQVTVVAQWRAITPVVASMLGNITFTSTSEFPIERVFP